VHFPESSIVSLIVTMTDGRSVEVGLVGSQGVAGVGALVGSPMPCDVVVQVAGDALVLRVEGLPRGGAAERTLAELLGRYTHALLARTIQIAACNRLHSIRQRAARWILTMADMAGSARLPLTHDLLATMIGARRASISGVAGGLQQSGLIEYRHGKLHIRDRRRLERAACECYRTLRVRS
jgi:CRP-like cAMP-binding protein